MVVLSTMIIILIIIFIISFSIEWAVDRDMNLTSNHKCGYVSFKRFMEEFKKYDKKYNLKNYVRDSSIIKYGDSLSTNIVYIHAGKIEFEGKNMIIKYFDYWKFKLWLIKYTHKIRNKTIVDNNIWD